MIEQFGTKNLAVGGKSIGGRIARLVAEEAGMLGLPQASVHSVGKPKRLPVDRLRRLQALRLMVQGDRDPFDAQSDVAAYGLSGAVQLHWLPAGTTASSRGRRRVGWGGRTWGPWAQ